MIDEFLAEAIQLFQQGRFDIAEMFLREAQAKSPDEPAILHLLGLTAFQRGRAAEGVDLIQQAITLDPRVPAYRSDLGLILKASGNWPEAAAAFRTSVELAPQSLSGWLHLGECQSELAQWEDAVSSYRAAIALDAGSANALCNLGIAMSKLGRLEEAVTCQQQALTLRPDFPSATVNLGCVLKDQGKLSQAIPAFRRALVAKPDYGRAHYNLACCLQEQGLLDEATTHYRNALASEPRAVDVWTNLGCVLREQKKWDEAERCFRQALDIEPHHDAALCSLGFLLNEQDRLTEAEDVIRTAIVRSARYTKHHSNLGSTLHAQGRLQEAIAAFHAALALEPDCADTHFNLSLAYLQNGDFAKGWPHYEWRWRKDNFVGGAIRHVTIPRWQGDAAQGRTILLWCEQGFGDSIHMARYGAELASLGWSVVLEAPPALYRLFRTIPGISVIRQGDVPPDCDVQASLMSLPGLAQRSPGQVPYLFPEPKCWSQPLDGLSGLKVGVVWRGNPQRQQDHRRSIPAAQFASALPAEGISTIILQTDATAEEVAAFRGPVFNAGPHLCDFAATAALISRLDLIISVDTAVCHLAGALGRPIWTLIEKVPAWQWMLGRTDSPWYPTMTLLRQARRGDWAGVIVDVRAKLTAFSGC